MCTAGCAQWAHRLPFSIGHLSTLCVWSLKIKPNLQIRLSQHNLPPAPINCLCLKDGWLDGWMDAWMNDGMMDDDGLYLKQRIGSWQGIHKCVLVLRMLLAVTVARVGSWLLPRVFILLLCENWQVCLRSFTKQAKNKNEKAAVALERGHLYQWTWFKQRNELTFLWPLTDVA